MPRETTRKPTEPLRSVSLQSEALEGNGRRRREGPGSRPDEYRDLLAGLEQAERRFAELETRQLRGILALFAAPRAPYGDAG